MSNECSRRVIRTRGVFAFFVLVLFAACSGDDGGETPDTGPAADGGDAGAAGSAGDAGDAGGNEPDAMPPDSGEPDSGPVNPACGNGALDANEACDDGDRDAGDGCSASCQIESGWSCPVVGEECQKCGDGVLQANERCDEGASADNMGCTQDCTLIEEHYSCPKPGEACVRCGDGMVQGKEVCDDGNTVSGDGCVFSCLAIEPGWVCSAAGSSCTVCGDGTLASGVEECDDGNFVSNDGCSATCTVDEGAVCFESGVLCAVCGNGYIEAIGNDPSGTPMLEECDDGNLNDGDGCSKGCVRDAAFSCPLPGTRCNQCGDGLVQGIERCDDHNTSSTDGCSSDCLTIEPNYNCFTEGVACVRCGNGKLEAGEACDDANNLGGDGCARDCRKIETGWRCQSDASGNFVGCGKCGNGVKELNEVCDDHNTAGGDGCNADCSMIEAGYTCKYPGFNCVLCGNGVLEPGEQCDEGGTHTAGCTAQCQIVPPWMCLEPGEPCELCGDSQVGSFESCDDGNTASGDGCSSTCELEPGYDCSGSTCLASACGDGARAGNEACDDGNQLSGDGCSTVCGVETGWVCGALGCRRTVCRDTVVEGAEQCDDGNAASGDGCSSTCRLEPNYMCPDPGQPCKPTVCGDGFMEGLEQCDDGGTVAGDGCSATCRWEPNRVCSSTVKECHGGSTPNVPCVSEMGCLGGGDCSYVDVTCKTTICGDGVVEGNEQCDDGGKNGVCRGGAQAGAACTSDAMCTGGGSCIDGCTSSCTIPPFYHCEGAPSTCRPIIDFVAVRRFNISNVSPDGLVYDPLRRAFAGHKKSDTGSPPIELCLDGSLIDKSDTTAGPTGTIYKADGTTQVLSATYLPAPRPVGGGMLEAAYDPFTGHYLYLTKQGSTVTLTDVKLCTLQSCSGSGYYQPGGDITKYQVTLTGSADAEGMTVGEDGDLYITDSVAEAVRVYPRRRDSSQNIIVPNCVQTPDPANNCTSFAASPTVSRGFGTASDDVLDAIFTVPGEGMVGLFNHYTGATSYTGRDLRAATTYPTSEYFSFYEPALTTNPPLYGRSALPGMLFDLGTLGFSYQQYAQSAETASDGGSFIICPNNPSEDCQLFARVCKTDADCSAIVPGTRCNTTAAVPFCSSRGDAVDDHAEVQRDSSANVIDVLANDSRSESSCIDPIKRVVSLAPVGSTVVTTVTTAQGGTVTISNGGANVTYAAPSMKCGFVDKFVYTANLGGNTLDSATVRVLVRCVCGDGVLDNGEQCDLGTTGNGALPKRCSTSCTLESVCGDDVVEGAEECDDGNSASGDACNPNCMEPRCGDGNVDVQSPFSEQCDLGLNNSNVTGSTCSTMCKVIASCGNHQVELGEECDDGNATSGDGCNSLCKVETKCGNGKLEAGEECDPGTANTCGGGAACLPLCFCANYCGDGRIGGTEQCDDGNTAAGDGCRPNCTAEICGDGIKDGNEQCDDGNNVATDMCTNSCMLQSICGDGMKSSTEQCDDGNQVSGDGCTSTCRTESATCGNGSIESGEQCDDGNTTAGDGCSATCLFEAGVCGDGKLDPGELCDDGNTTNGDGCDASCRSEGCGDGVLVSIEDCDDGNRVSGDGCSEDCHFEGPS